MNKVFLIGNLTKDPELTTTTSGISVCRFSIAINRRFKNANGEQEVDYLNIVAWRALADLCGQYLSKGKKVGITGQIQTRSYEQDGVRKYATDIIADDVEFLTPKGEATGDGGYSNNKPVRAKVSPKEMQPMEDDELPFQKKNK